MKFKRFKKAYLIFSRKERNASLLLVVLIAASIAFPAIEQRTNHHRVTAGYGEMKNMFSVTQPTEQKIDNKQTTANHFERYVDDHPENKISSPRQLFDFDPNTITLEDWQKLGVPENVAGRIMNYRSKGGYFREEKDVLKIYGFRQEDFDVLKPYMKITEQDHTTFTEEEILLPVEMKITDVNSASKEDFMRLGFSASLAERIINFRDGLGGFCSIEQIRSVYGMDMNVMSAAESYFLIDTKKIQLLNLNTSALDELAGHIYISDELAKAIIDYRETSGRFISVSEVMKVPGMYKSLFEKLKPYLAI